MNSDSKLNDVVSKFYSKTYGSRCLDHQHQLDKKKIHFDKYNLIKIGRHSESLPPVIKRALEYLYPLKTTREIKPSSEYDRLVRKLSNVNLDVSTITPLNKRFRLKKLSLVDIHNTFNPLSQKSNSQEYINCIGYNGQAESEYMRTKEGINEYKSLYSLILKDSGLCLDRTRAAKSLTNKHGRK